MDTKKKLKRDDILEWLEHDKDATKDLFDRKKDAFRQRVREIFPAASGTSSDDLFRRVMAWISSPKCPAGLARSAEAYKHSRKKARVDQRHFIFNAGLSTPSAERDAMLASLPVYHVTALSEPHPPYKHIISESPEIYKKWRSYFATGKQADERKARLPIHQLDPTTLVADIPPHEGARLLDPSGELVGLVIRNFCPDDEALAWADAAAEAQVPVRRNVRVRFFYYYYYYLFFWAAYPFVRWKTQEN